MESLKKTIEMPYVVKPDDIEWIPIEELEIGFPRYLCNPDLIENHRRSPLYKRIRDSIREEGLKNFLIVRPKIMSGRNCIYIGNNRYLAILELLSLGEDVKGLRGCRPDRVLIPCLVAFLTKEQIKEICWANYEFVEGVDQR